MTQFTEAYDFHARTLVDRNGEKIGKVDEVYVDHEGGEPEWALVHTGLLGTKKSFVPLHGASPSGEDVHVPVDRQAIMDSPGVETEGELSEAQERRLFEHYGVSYTTENTTAGGVPGPSTAVGREASRDFPAERGRSREGAGARDFSRPTTDAPVGRDVSSATRDDAMTRSEEELRVGTRTHETGRVRLRKYVVTEQVQQTVQVQREEVRVVREPITDANVDDALAGPEISDAEHEVVLHEEVPVVEKRVVPKERVRLEKDTVTDEQRVSEEIRKEQIDVDEPSGDPNR